MIASRVEGKVDSLSNLKRLSPMLRMGDNGSTSARFKDRSKNKLNL